MKISLLQNDIVWGNPTANQEKIEEILDAHEADGSLKHE